MNDNAQRAWRAIAPLLPASGLLALRDELMAGGERLCRGVAVRGRDGALHTPSRDGWEPAEADPVAYALWKGEGLTTLAEVEDARNRVLFEAEVCAYEWLFVRHLSGWWNDAPHDQACAELAAAVGEELARRKAVAA